jgi:hypothetical protein
VREEGDLQEGGGEELDYQGGAFGFGGRDEGGEVFDVVAGCVLDGDWGIVSCNGNVGM